MAAAVKVDDVQVSARGAQVELSARVRSASLAEPFRLWFRFPASPGRRVRRSGSPLLPALLLPSMALGEPLEIAEPVSAVLLARSRQLMDVYHTWWPELRRVEVRAKPEPGPRWPPRATPAACFFSLGVDSFFTLLNNLDGQAYGTAPIESLLFVAGFDVRLDNTGLLGEIEAGLSEVATATKTDPVWIETNLRDLTDPIVSWNQFHGSAMASVGIALERAFSALYVSSSYSYVYLPPWGSHPLTDPLWSTPRVRFIHDGCEASRPEKIEAIVSEPCVRKTLRACWENRDNLYNCGVCEKCLRTMASLEGLGLLPEMETFPDSFALELLDTLDWNSPDVTRRFEVILKHLPAESSGSAFREEIERHLQRRAAGPPAP